MTTVSPEQQPVRRMSDLGPRRSMDMGRRVPPQPQGQPQGQAPAPQPQARPMPQPRPVAPSRPMSQARPRPAAATSGYDQAPAAAPAPKAAASSRRRGWLTALQFVVGLLVIIGVATAVIALYMRYYQ